jgi:purine-binding chemotaxis protein CheW
VSDEITNQDTHKYLVYQLATETFATPLIEVREVIEFRAAKPIPHTSIFFKGVINIRGEIVGVVDLRERFNLPSSTSPMAQLVFETENGPLAAIVDRVHSVTIILEKDLERRPALHSADKDRSYFLGVGKVDDKLITLVSLRKVLSPDQLIDLSEQPT